MALFSRRAKTPRPETCEHLQRDPRWNSMEDAGVMDRVDHYLCRGCGEKLAEPE